MITETPLVRCYFAYLLRLSFLFFNQPATPSRPPVFVDWASGVAPKPDPRTISKHVQRMVDVSASLFQASTVFKPPYFNYSLAWCHPDSLPSPLLFANNWATMLFICCHSQSVFKNYDHDENGFINQEDFEKIAASFPFSFCVMDKEKWVSWQVMYSLRGYLWLQGRGSKSGICRCVVASLATGNIK